MAEVADVKNEFFAGYRIENPITYPGWDELLLPGNEGSFFHSSNWARVLHESYGFTPLYFSAMGGGPPSRQEKLEALVPVMEVDSVFTGKRGVSLPFTDYCEPILPGGGFMENAMDTLIDYGKRSGWKSLEIRGGKDKFGEKISPSCFFYGHRLDLSPGEGRLHSGLRDSTKRNIKKAEKEGVKTGLYQSMDAVREFYRLNCLTRKLHGLPPQPFKFFRKLHEHIIGKKQGLVMLASHNGAVIAGAVCFHFGGKAIYKYGASDSRYQALRANNLIMWEAIKWYSRNGFTEFCFGRTEPENKGLLQFKEGWGAEEYTINYYKYDFRERSFIENAPPAVKVKNVHNRVFARMPVPVLKLAGTVLYRHMG